MTAPKTPNPALALASAEDDFETEVRAMYEAPTGINHDLREIEALARLTRNYIRDAGILIGRMEYARNEDRRWSFADCLIDTLSDELQHGAGAVVAAHIKKMEAGL